MLDRGQVNCFEAGVQNDVVECIKRACRTNEPEWLPALSEINDLSLSNFLCLAELPKEKANLLGELYDKLSR